jgi:hypothetical protein
MLIFIYNSNVKIEFRGFLENFGVTFCDVCIILQQRVVCSINLLMAERVYFIYIYIYIRSVLRAQRILLTIGKYNL